MDIVTEKLDNVQKSNELPFCWRNKLTKVEVKQRKFSSCLIEKKEWGGWRGGLLEKAETWKWRWLATTACLLQAQVVPRWRSLHKEHWQRQEFRQRATQRLTSCEQKILVLRSKVGIPERAKEEKEGKIGYSDFSCFCNYCSIFCPSPSSQAGSICSLCSVLELPSPSPCLLHFQFCLVMSTEITLAKLSKDLFLVPTHPLHITVSS